MHRPLFAACLSLAMAAHGQQPSRDTLRTIELAPATVEAVRPDATPLPAVQGTFIFSGKKSEVLAVAATDAALAEKQGRQLMAMVPGLFVYDMDGTGNQLNVAVRGLDPHRGWEFNIRKDGVPTNTDMYGYPASHYSPPMEAVDRIELVRGTGSLQYGAQFGGMLNYVTKAPDSTRAFAFEGVGTAGSFGLVSTFARASGTWRKWSYNAWVQRRSSDGYRANGRSEYRAECLALTFAPSPKLRLRAEWTRSDYVVQLAGPLNDSMFQADPRSSTRARNYYEPNIHVPSLALNWAPTARTQLQWTTSAILGDRRSALFDKAANIPDAIDSVTLQYAPRQVDIDDYRSFTSELRVRHDHLSFGNLSTLTAGVQLARNAMHRRQQGRGTAGSDYDLTLTAPGWGRDLHYSTTNLALFAEERWRVTSRLSLTAGVRMELGTTELTGTTTYAVTDGLPNTVEHRFPLFGAGGEYALGSNGALYGGWSQAYRPVMLKDIVPASTYEVADKDLKDAHGGNAEVGVRGAWRALRWDVGGFRLAQADRMGAVTGLDTAGNTIVHRTNTGSSVTQGVECLLQADLPLGHRYHLSVFTSTACMDARYVVGTVRTAAGNTDITGNRVESAPQWTSRNGITLRHRAFRVSALWSYVSETFADALNTMEPNASGTVGRVPAHAVLDVAATVRITRALELRLNLNNALDEHYFTKRPQFYPGPGIWPSDGRGWSVSAAVHL